MKIPPRSDARRQLLARGLAVSLLPGLGLTAARAGTPLLIWPIDPIIPAGQQAAALWLENQGGARATLQVRIFDWRQDGGEDRYEPQQGVLPSPPIATIAPGGRQLVRLIATRPATPGVEQPYRVFIDELPTPEQAEADQRAGASVKLQLRYAVPLFIYGAGALPPLSRTRDGLGGPDRDALQPALSWDSMQQDGKPVLVLDNSGAAHARVTAVEWSSPDGRSQVINPGLLGYVLAGARMRFPIAQAIPPKAALRVQINGRPADIRRAAG
ncbi:fimbria/pilus periplasmic chaperone [Xylophilus rhododendri]|uniref:Fimbria/pilus periplasmic chaperone n=1 Tax=Xylophilus rhododendri TaxID=2697032 RepID=A0A857J880_9BURK|nr:fimbria/pilus periplasmic chaperone [Xylophilus rhododendri]QHI98978.1 fimbria/pilus periplasmic chaperone [Xylophilus rhododendri]